MMQLPRLSPSSMQVLTTVSLQQANLHPTTAEQIFYHLRKAHILSSVVNLAILLLNLTTFSSKNT